MQRCGFLLTMVNFKYMLWYYTLTYPFSLSVNLQGDHINIFHQAKMQSGVKVIKQNYLQNVLHQIFYI